MKTTNPILSRLATLAIIAATGVSSCWAAESAAGKTSADLRPNLEKWGLHARVQGGRGTCSVFTLNAAIEYAVATKRQKGTRLSVEFLNWAANQIDNSKEDGGCFSELWAGFAAHGVCREVDMPYQASFDPAHKPDQKAVAHAKRIQALGLQIHWLKEWDSRHGASEEQVAEIKRTLARGWPVTGGFLWPKNEGPLWKDGVLQMCRRRDVMDGHSVLLVGFRDDAAQPGGGVFLIRNSAGASRDAMLSYRYVRRYMNDAAWIGCPGVTEGGPRP